MNSFELKQKYIDEIKATYPAGTRIELINMNDPYTCIPSGTRGTVECVDDIGSIHMRWDTGSGLALIPEEDSFRALTQEEIDEENISPTINI